MSEKTSPFSLILIVLAGLFVSCSVEDVPADGRVTPVYASDEVEAFFLEYLPENSYRGSAVDFAFSDRDYSQTECFLINSMEEFRGVVSDEVEVPHINFKKYSLIIGQCVLGDPGYVLEKQVVYPGENDMELRLVYRRLDGVSPCVITNFYFWGLYPKLPDLPLTVNLDII